MRHFGDQPKAPKAAGPSEAGHGRLVVMPKRVEGLAALDPEELATALPEPAQLAPHEWLYLVGAVHNGIAADPESGTGARDVLLRALAAAESAGAIDHREYVIRRLYLAAVLGGGDPEALDLLVDALPMTVERAARMAPGWQRLPVAEMRALRAAKNLLNPALMLQEKAPDARIAAWAEVYPLLP